MRLVALTAAAVLLLDQVTKYLVVFALDLRGRGTIEVFSPFLDFRMAWNRGINFGLFAGDAEVTRWMLTFLALAISGWVVVWIARAEAAWPLRMSAGVLVGGALGNAVDRVLYGAVADFLTMSCCGIRNPYSFNVADIAIFSGALGLVFLAGPKKTP